MSSIYGHKWVSGFGEADDGTWLRGLRDISPKMMAYGVRQCLDQRLAWPPTLPEFLGLCQAIDDELVDRLMVKHMPGSFDTARMSYADIARAKRDAKSKTMREINKILKDEPRKFFEEREEFLALPDSTVPPAPSLSHQAYVHEDIEVSKPDNVASHLKKMRAAARGQSVD